MILCQFCRHKTEALFTYVKHMKLHRNLPNVSFKCGMTTCNMAFKNFNAFKSHSYRYHKQQPATMAPVYTNDLTCHVEYCAVHCDDLISFLSHLKTHVKEGTGVTCPFKQCKRTFTILSTFTSHLSRCHKGRTEQNLLENIVQKSNDTEGHSQETSSVSNVVCHSVDRCNDKPSNDAMIELLDVDAENTDEDLFLQNLALFYLKLQAKMLLPSSVIQTVIEGFQEIHDMSQLNQMNKLHEKLILLGVPERDVKKVIDEVKDNDLFQSCNTHKLKTDHKRKTVFKESFNYIEPHPICLGNNEAGKECFAQYIPIKQTIAGLLQNESIREQHRSTHLDVHEKDILKDIWDGKIISQNALLKTDPLSVGLILYQDSFEVVNPLGSGKKKHKLLAVYLTLGDILPHNRSTTDHMQLVLLCRDQDFRYFGQDLVLGTLVKDLKDLEVSGTELPNE
ncbi:uncharacterized protein LOC106528650 isoform X2 [Austrofundulus limnaeus]|uniref:Uncharacterized protein LOC106528650 isoform X2 n=1 Tax=Austrofundulus limnaeus TaxID=52670 RepID=A0A2I4CH58_AUSLI|nr:PREDICTED: uncharacterized protein LOC106528650 isoform X2 [Austrofundulus limnaeus]